jgi:hypothetical protein
MKKTPNVQTFYVQSQACAGSIRKIPRSKGMPPNSKEEGFMGKSNQESG